MHQLAHEAEREVLQITCSELRLGQCVATKTKRQTREHLEESIGEFLTSASPRGSRRGERASSCASTYFCEAAHIAIAAAPGAAAARRPS